MTAIDYRSKSCCNRQILVVNLVEQDARTFAIDDPEENRRRDVIELAGLESERLDQVQDRRFATAANRAG